MRRGEVGKRLGRWETRLVCGREMSNWHCVSVSGWKCPINPRSPALFWISVIPYSTACIKMRNHRLLLQSLQRRTVMELWGGLSSFSGLEMEELLKAVNIVECEVHGFIYQLDDLVT
ncbi:neuromedin-S isoform X2 [Serinus canaria]|uniref:neuromedin-S isoform X2 n=1 Tax=Serinus canaria TaxID=9135 RepID=UPI0011AEBC13|nr:neuromedin-S isoform X2 [Serinus canaria]